MESKDKQKNPELIEKEIKLVVTRGKEEGGVGGIGGRGSKIQTSSHKIS